MIDTIRIAQEAWDSISRHASDAWPEECCGLLIGAGATILAAAPARNVAGDRRRRFRIEPEDHFAAMRTARGAGRAVVGAYHSHPDGPPAPSETDLREAFDDPDFIHLIVTADRPPAETRMAAYRLSTGNFVAVRLVRVP